MAIAYAIGVAIALATLVAAGNVRADARIDALATQLGHDPAQIFAYLRDDVAVELYSGSLRGAVGTLVSKAGSPIDRAALGVELLRASGYTAHYAQGTLGSTDAQRVVARMFPGIRRALGCYNPGALSAPQNDYQLNQWAAQHTWVEYRPTPASPYTPFDPTFAGSTIGVQAAVPATTFDEIPDAQKQKVRFRLTAEFYSQAGALYGFPLGTVTPLDRTFNTADLIDKPVTFGHFVSQSTLPGLAITASTNTYSPYMVIGDSTLDPRDYDVIRGDDYSELLTNFPLGSNILTGVFVDMDVIDPANPSAPQSTRRTLLDRIGYATRQTGGTIAYTPSPDNGPALTTLDLLTVQVAPSRQPTDGFAARQARMAALQAEAAAIAPAVAAVPTPDLMSPADVALVTRAVALNRAIAIAFMELATATFEGAAGRSMDSQAAQFLVKAEIATPRITVARASLANDHLQFGLDVRRNTLLTYPLPGISFANARHFEQARGLTESLLEGTVLSQLTGGDAVTLGSLLLAQPDGGAYIPLAAGNVADVDGLALSADAKARIRDALLAGRFVLAPRAPVTVNGAPLTAWLESDPVTGQSISTFEDGTHNAFVEYAALYFNRFGEQNLENSMAKFVGNINSVALVSLAYMSGLLDAIAADDEFGESVRTTKEIIEEVLDNALNGIMTYLKWTTAELEIKGPYGLIYSMVDGLLEGLETLKKAIVLALGDPQVPDILVSPPQPRLPATVVPGAVAGVGVTVAPDPRFVLPYSGSELPTVFLATVTNTGPATDSFVFQPQYSDYPFGITNNPSPPLTLGPGESGELSICLAPGAPLLAPGGPVAFGGRVISTTAPTVAAPVSGTTTMPSATAASIRVLPASANVAAGATTTTTLTIDSLGNADTTVALSASTMTGLTLTGLPASVAVGAGKSVSVPLTLGVAAGTPPGMLLGALLSADFGGLEPATAGLAVTVVSATTRCTLDAGDAANDIGRTGLAASLFRLAADLDALRAATDDAVARAAVLSELDYLIGQQLGPGDQAYLQPYGTTLQALRTSLAAAAAAAIPALLTSIDAALCDMRTTLASASQRDFSLGLAPTTATNIPGQATTVNINIANIVAVPRVFDVTVAGAPPGITATINAPTITVPASYQTNGCCGSPPLTVTFMSSDGVARAFDYTVTATPRDQPGSARTAHGEVTLRPDLVRVVAVTPAPAFGPAGTPVSVAVRAMDSLNAPGQYYVEWSAADRNGHAVRSGQTAAVTVGSGDGLFDFAPFPIDTTGLADGTYTVGVTIRSANPCCAAVPGATGQGAFIVGSPFSAVLSVTPQSVAPGDSTVGLALALSHDSLPTPSIVPSGALSLAAEARSIARAGDFLYVCQADRVTVLDVSSPLTPVTVGDFATDVLQNGYGTVACNIDGNALVLAYSGDTPTSFDTIKVVAYDISGVNATTLPVRQTATPTDLGKLFGGSALFSGTTGYMPTTIYIYNPYSYFIAAQYGNLLQLDFSDPTVPVLAGELFHHFPPPSPDTNDPVYGGPNMVFGAVPIGNYVYLASSTSTGGAVDTGVGRVTIADSTQLATNCPGDPNPCIAATLDVPGTRLLFGIARQGNTVLVAGDSVGYYDAVRGLDGNLVVAAIDVTDPLHPVLRSTLTTALRNNREQNMCGANGDAGGATLQPLDQQFYAVGGFNPASCSWVMTFVDATDPDHLRVIPYDVTDVLTSTLLAGNTLYALTRSGVLAYDYSIVDGPAITARVDMAKGNGVAVVPGSFNLAPTAVDTSAPDRDTYTWTQPSVPTITWQADVQDMQPGETRDVAYGGRIDFTLPALGSGELPVNGVSVVSDQAMSIAPESQTVGISRPATYTVTLQNPGPAPITYALAVDGVDPAWVVALDSPVTVPAGGSATATLTLQSTLGDYGLPYPFVVTATAPAYSASARATLYLNGYDRPVGGDPQNGYSASTVVLDPPTLTVGRGDAGRVVLHTANVGTVAQQFSYGPASLPSGWTVTFENNNVATAPDATLDVTADITTPASVTPGPYIVGVNLYNPYYTAYYEIPVTVGSAGVTLAVTPGSGSATTPYSVNVTNTGLASDTFALSAAGPLGPVVTFATTSVTLAAGASQAVTATLGDTSYLPAGTSTFDVIAQSTTSAPATARATVAVALAAQKGVALAGVPPAVTVPSTPATRSFAVQMRNAGNVEDTYTLAIASTSPNVTASLHDASDAPVASLSPLALPGQALAQFALDATLNSGSSGTVVVTAQSLSDDAVAGSVTLTLTTDTVAMPIVAAAPNPLAFGNQTVGVTGSAQASTFTNTGDAPFTVTTLAMSGTNSADFAFASGSNACAVGTVLAASGGNCVVYVTFTPGATGPRGASVTVTDSATTTTATLGLTGTGVAANTCFSGSVPGGTATACFTGGGAGCEYAHAAFIPLTGDPASPPAGTAPAGYSFPFGLFDFATQGCTTGGSLTFTIDYPGALPPGSVYYKYGSPDGVAPPTWYTLPATVQGSSVTFALPAGNISDPGGPAFVPSSAPPARATPVPALDARALAGLALLVAVAAALARRKAKR
ncbi:MAG: choice-of-anchor D domain-containing protein [Proteobacteria bacterium]|nr:choice-of-anchor D domain-containing protein [Pseudomonadota bacterium]